MILVLKPSPKVALLIPQLVSPFLFENFHRDFCLFENICRFRGYLIGFVVESMDRIRLII